MSVSLLAVERRIQQDRDQRNGFKSRAELIDDIKHRQHDVSDIIIFALGNVNDKLCVQAKRDEAMKLAIAKLCLLPIDPGGFVSDALAKMLATADHLNVVQAIRDIFGEHQEMIFEAAKDQINDKVQIILSKAFAATADHVSFTNQLFDVLTKAKQALREQLMDMTTPELICVHQSFDPSVLTREYFETYFERMHYEYKELVSCRYIMKHPGQRRVVGFVRMNLTTEQNEISCVAVYTAYRPEWASIGSHVTKGLLISGMIGLATAGALVIPGMCVCHVFAIRAYHQRTFEEIKDIVKLETPEMIALAQQSRHWVG